MKISGAITIDRSDVHAKGQGQRSKVKVTKVKTNIAPTWVFPDRNSSLNSQVVTKSCTKAYSCIVQVSCWFSRSSVKFQGHMGQKIDYFDPNERFRTITSVWIHRWLRNNTQNLKGHRRGSLLFFDVIHQISRSQGQKKSTISVFSISGL